MTKNVIFTKYTVRPHPKMWVLIYKKPKWKKRLNLVNRTHEEATRYMSILRDKGFVVLYMIVIKQRHDSDLFD